jgi:hypothetical protein
VWQAGAAVSSYGWTEEDLARHMAKVTATKPFNPHNTSVPIEAAGYTPSLNAPKPSKYRNRKTTVDGITFDSAHEAKCWMQLQIREKAGEIRDLRRQGKFPLMVNGAFVGFYVSDFDYYDVAKNTRVVADAKGMKTPIYQLKKKLMQAIHGIEILEL